MKTFIKFILPVFILIIFFSCEKESVTPPYENIENNTQPYNQYGTPFGSIPENEDIVMYEVNLRAFSSTGDIQGVINRLEKIKALGVNVIWLMPIHPIGEINSVNSPYSIKDYKAVSSEYGTLEDLRTLTNEAHQKGMAVIMDWVANHTAWDNDWIENKDWYSQDGQGNIIHPAGTNWKDVADLNYSNLDMRKAMIDAMTYWIFEANIDGYRCDFADGVPFEFWQAALDTLSTIPNRQYVFLAEGQRSDHFQAGFNLNFGWSFYGQLKNVFNGQNASSLFSTHNSDYSAIPSGKHLLRFTTNHDESAWDNTPIVLFNGVDGSLAASVITIFTGGVPLFYTGQEVGRSSKVPFFSNSPINWNENPEMLEAYKKLMNFYKGSDVAKTGTNTNHGNTNVVCLKKLYNSEELLIIVNVRNSIVDFSIPAELQYSNWTNALTNVPVTLGISMELSNYEYFILKN